MALKFQTYVFASPLKKATGFLATKKKKKNGTVLWYRLSKNQY